MRNERMWRLTGLGLVLLLLVGCLPLSLNRDAINRQVDVFGLTLSSHPDLHTFKGVNAEIVPCLHGYEYRFETLDLAIGTDRHDAIRRIFTRNHENRLFGISIGDDFASAQGHLVRAGFTPTVNPYRFVQGWAHVTLFVDEAGMVFGLAIEVLD